MTRKGSLRRKKQAEERQSAVIPKALSSENLQLHDLPNDRSYILFPQEKYDLNLQYFPTQTLIRPKINKDAEKELRLCYRAGHLDEIKRKQFGKVYHFTRKYYMDLELQALKESTKRKEKKKKKKSKRILATRKSDYNSAKYTPNSQ